MEVKWFISVFLWWVILCVYFNNPSVYARGYTICDIDLCNCTCKTSWKYINCSVPDDQDVTFDQKTVTITKDVMEINIDGGRELTFGLKAFNSLQGLALLRIVGTKKVVMENKSFFNISSASLLIEIRNCDESVIIKTRAFDSIEGTVRIETVNIKEIVIEQSSFSKLSNGLFQNIQKLDLREKAFDITNQIVNQRLVTTLSFINVFIPALLENTFSRALASIEISNSTIGKIHTESFRGTQIDSIKFYNTTIDEIGERAFKDGTQVVQLLISKCNISKLYPRSISVGLSNFTLNFSNIGNVMSRAIDMVVVAAAVMDNQIGNIENRGFVFNESNSIEFDNNIVDSVDSSFIKADSSQLTRFSFRGNEIHLVKGTAFSFLNALDQRHVMFNDNSFSDLCNCTLEDWVEHITNGSQISLFMSTSFCTINRSLSKCFSLETGIINMQNFTDMKCENYTECKIEEESNKANHTVLFHLDDSHKRNWIIFVLTVVSVFVLGILITFIVLIVRGSRWLKEKGYFRNNLQYNNNDLSTEEEGTIVTIDEPEKLEIPEELSVEFLQMLAQRLDDPTTSQEATEMVVRLYEMFIIEDSYENNNRQDEEAHLYEELGNLNLQIPPPPYEEENREPNHTGPRNILRMMEEKFNLAEDQSNSNTRQPPFVSEYSEPTDAAVHLYSELKSKHENMDKIEDKNSKNNGSLKNINCILKNTNTNGSLKNTLRPLPSKPTSKTFLLDEAGPSTKL